MFTLADTDKIGCRESCGGIHRKCGHTIGANFLLPPASKVCEDYVLHLSVSHSVDRGEYLGRNTPGRYTSRKVPPMGRYTPSKADTPTPAPPGTPLGQVHHPLDRYIPHRPQCMLGYIQQAGGTHPTGMHSCLNYDHRCVLW